MPKRLTLAVLLATATVLVAAPVWAQEEAPPTVEPFDPSYDYDGDGDVDDADREVWERVNELGPGDDGSLDDDTGDEGTESTIDNPSAGLTRTPDDDDSGTSGGVLALIVVAAVVVVGAVVLLVVRSRRPANGG